MAKHSERFGHYAGKSTEERRELLTQEGVLESHRLMLSLDPVVQERLAKLKHALADLKREYPEIITAQLVGSMVKGYAVPESDLDITFLIDGDTLAQKNAEAIAKGEASRGTSYYQRLIPERLRQELRISEEQTKHVWVYSLDKEELEEARSDIALTSLFMPSLSRDVIKYRKRVFHMLGQDTEHGEQRWKAIMERLWSFENEGFNDELKNARRSLYPWTLVEGERYFLGVHRDESIEVEPQ